MKRSADWSYQWIFYLAAGLLFASTLLRSLVLYRDSPELGRALGLLTVWLVLLVISETAFSRWPPNYFLLYLVPQTILILALLFMLSPADYFAILFAILSMQIMQRFNPGAGAIWIGLVALLMTFPLAIGYEVFQAIVFVVFYTAVNAMLAAYALATRRTQVARARNQALAQELGDKNRQLQAYANQLEQLAVARERHRLARELHDAATQTIFSMTLTTQSALLLLERDPGRVGAQLDRLNQLAQGALSEMRALISELRPERVAEGGLVTALRQHLADRRLPENISVSLEVEGDRRLSPIEEQGLFRIVQEALNNIVKHAQTPQAQVRLHLLEPLWIEVEDQGQGFDLRQARDSGRVGLVGMSERAAEIGWTLEIISSPGAGTHIRVEKSSGEKQR